MLILIPLYPDTVDGYVYSVNLLNYTEISSFSKIVYWIMFLSMISMGAIKLIILQLRKEKYQKNMMYISLVQNILVVIILTITKEVYAVIVAFVILLMKSLLFIKTIKTE